MGVKIGVILKNWKEHSFISDYVCGDIIETRSEQLDKSDLFKKMSRNNIQKLLAVTAEFVS